jgi:hypothetical protein
VEYAGVKQRRAWMKEEIRKVMWCYMYCRQHFTENYKKMYECGDNATQIAECTQMPRNY